MFSIHTVLHPTDFSEPSAYALSLASALASDYGAHLVIVHVVAAPMILPDGVLLPNLEDGQADLRQKLDHLEVADERIDVDRRLEEGNPTIEILNLARLCQADLIVMGSHRRRGMNRWIMGSVADAVMRKATCPVLIVTSAVCRGEPAPPQNQRQSTRI
jgi:universal stress protein A